MSSNKKRKSSDIYNSSSTHYALPKTKSACKRCRMKKIKCDQELPSCKKCSKVNEPCVSLDAATGEDVPRSYMLFLEDRVTAMAYKLQQCGVDLGSIPFNIPAMSTDPPYQPELKREMNEGEYPIDTILGNYLIQRGKVLKGEATELNQIRDVKPVVYVEGKDIPDTGPSSKTGDRQFDILQSNKDITQIESMEPNAAASFLGDSSGISFAKLVFTAANFSPDSIYDELDIDIERREKKLNQYKVAETTHSFDALELPPRDEAEQLIIRYFTDTNSQLPLFHREFFLKKYFEPIYGPWNNNISLASDHTPINQQFVLPHDIYVTPDDERSDPDVDLSLPWVDSLARLKQPKHHPHINVPARFKIPLFFLNTVFSIGHATQVLKSDIRKLVTFKRRALQFRSALFNGSDKLETLAGTLLIVLYSLMRPNVPGVWYIMGSVLRLTVDLGLHDEKLNQNYDPFRKEMRRRLFWCTYSLDRQICSYFGRPFGIPEESITTRFPSLLDDSKIIATPTDTDDYSDNISFTASSKVIATAMYKIRRIQGNIVKVLYAPRSELPRQYSSLSAWKESVLIELDHWYDEEVPKSFDSMNCKFNTFFFDLNYHYSKTILFGLSPKSPQLNERGFYIVRESTKGTIDVFDGLCSTKKMSYTWVATHNMFMTGMTYLYVIYYYSGDVNNDTETEVIAYTGKVLNVLKNLIGTCEAAKNCYKTYKMLCAAVIKLRYGNVYAPNGPQGKKTGKKHRVHKPKVHRENKQTYNNKIVDDNLLSSSNTSVEVSGSSNNSTPDATDPHNKGNIIDPLDQFFSELGKVDDFLHQNEIHPHGQQSHPQQNIPGQVISMWNQVGNPSALESNNATFKEEPMSPTYPPPAPFSMNSTGNTNIDTLLPTQSHKRVSTVHDKDIGDLLYQVTSQSMWDELFSNQTTGPSGSDRTQGIHGQETLPSSLEGPQTTPEFGNMGLF